MTRTYIRSYYNDSSTPVYFGLDLFNQFKVIIPRTVIDYTDDEIEDILIDYLEAIGNVESGTWICADTEDFLDALIDEADDRNLIPYL